MSERRDPLLCPMCGTEVPPDKLACSTGCPTGGNCGQLCCPGCGFAVTDPSKSVLGTWLMRLLQPQRDRA